MSSHNTFIPMLNQQHMKAWRCGAAGAQVLASPPLVRRAPAREPGKENYGTLNLQLSAAPKAGR